MALLLLWSFSVFFFFFILVKWKSMTGRGLCYRGASEGDFVIFCSVRSREWARVIGRICIGEADGALAARNCREEQFVEFFVARSWSVSIRQRRGYTFTLCAVSNVFDHNFWKEAKLYAAIGCMLLKWKSTLIASLIGIKGPRFECYSTMM